VKKVELNLIDKAVAFFNPNAAVERLASRAKLTKFEYDATMYNRQRRVPSQLQGAEGFRSNYDRVEMMKRARDLDQNFGLVRSLLLKFATHVAANITYQARTTDQNVNSDVEAYWNSWWDKCDLSGRHTGSILMQIATMSMLRDGDFFFILVRDQDGNLRLQGVEADRIGDPFRTYTSLNLIGGIHINQETGAPDGYDVYLRTFGNAYMFQATIAANQVFHLYDPLRIDQYRGVTAFCTAINDATDIYEIVQMEKMAAKIASSQGGIIKRTNNNASDLANLTNDLDSNNQTIKIESIEPGRITYLEPGEEMQFPDSPNRPGNGFQEFHKILLRNICMGVGIPYSFAVDPSAMSGPTARLEMQQASRTFKRHQKLLEDKVLRPVKNIVIADAVSRGLIKNNIGTKTTKGIFNFGASVSIDLSRESDSSIAEFKAGLRTGSQIMSERGEDFESSIILKAQEAKKISDLANQYNIPATSISDITESALFAQAQSRSQLNPDGSPATTEQGATTDGSPTPTGQEALIDYSLNGAQISSLIQIINAVAAGAITQEGANAIIRGAFPNIPDSVIQSIVAGINVGTLAPTGKVTAGEAAQVPTPPPIDQTKPEKLGSNDVTAIGEQDTETGKYESGGDGDIDVGEVREPTEKGAVENLPTGSTKEGKLTPKVPSILEEFNCGTGAGGFQPGNTCAGGGGIKSSIRDATPSGYGPSTSSQEKTKEQRMRGESIDDAINRKVGYQVDNGNVKIVSDKGGWVVSVAQPEGKPKQYRSYNRQQAINQAYTELYPDTELVPHPSDIGEKSHKKSNLEIPEGLDLASIKMLIQGMMGGIELAKYDGIDFTPPQGVKEAAKRGLEVRATKPASQRGGTPVGIARARDLSGGREISPDTARRMKAFFDRHEVDKEGSTWSEKGKGWQAWQLWGGDAGYAWAKKLVKQMNSRDEQLEEPAACPIATQDIKTNLENRQNAVDDANYGPANPNEPNEDYWKAKADEFQGDVATAKKMLCGNCAAFNQTKKLLGCISKGIGEDAGEVEKGGNLGYCEIFDFKCAAKRTCDAWIVGGPITDKKIDKKV
jgi:lambda family phage portal protein